MTIKKVFIAVSSAALAGMVMGGLFGLISGLITPEFFRHIVPWQELQPQGIAAFFGATVGVILGGGLGCFAVLLQAISEWRKKSPDETAVK